MTFWLCLFHNLYHHSLTIPTVTYILILALSTPIMAEVLTSAKDMALKLLRKINP